MRCFASLMSRALARHRRHGEAQGVGAQLVDQMQRIDDVALGLAHLGALLVADEGVDDDALERRLAHEVLPIIIIRATQKKMMSKP
jgi:hypothetical protein